MMKNVRSVHCKPTVEYNPYTTAKTTTATTPLNACESAYKQHVLLIPQFFFLLHFLVHGRAGLNDTVAKCAVYQYCHYTHHIQSPSATNSMQMKFKPNLLYYTDLFLLQCLLNLIDKRDVDFCVQFQRILVICL